MMVKFRLRDEATKKIIGYETLFPTNTDNTDYQWAMSTNGTDWEKGIYTTPNVIREAYLGVQDYKGNEIYELDMLSMTIANKTTYHVVLPLTATGSQPFTERHPSWYEIVGDVYDDDLVEKYKNQK